MNCPNCGAPLAEGAQFCTSCGTKLQSTQQPTYQTQNTAQGGYAQPTYPPQGYAYPPQGYVQQNAAPDGPYRVLGAWAYWGLTLLYSLPLIGWIFALVFACSNTNINRRNHARAYWITVLIAVVVGVLAYLLFGEAIRELRYKLYY